MSNIKTISTEALNSTSLFRSATIQSYYLNTRDITANTDLSQTSHQTSQSTISTGSEKQNSADITSKTPSNLLRNILPKQKLSDTNKSNSSLLATQSSSSSMTKTSFFQSIGNLISSSTNNEESAKNIKVNSHIKQEPPENYICPITQELMETPAIVFPSGQTYEKSAIEKHKDQGGLDPITRMPIQGIVINYALKNNIDEWKKENISQITDQNKLKK